MKTPLVLKKSRNRRLGGKAGIVGWHNPSRAWYESMLDGAIQEIMDNRDDKYIKVRENIRINGIIDALYYDLDTNEDDYDHMWNKWRKSDAYNEIWGDKEQRAFIDDLNNEDRKDFFSYMSEGPVHDWEEYGKIVEDNGSKRRRLATLEVRMMEIESMIEKIKRGQAGIPEMEIEENVSNQRSDFDRLKKSHDMLERELLNEEGGIGKNPRKLRIRRRNPDPTLAQVESYIRALLRQATLDLEHGDDELAARTLGDAKDAWGDYIDKEVSIEQIIFGQESSLTDKDTKRIDKLFSDTAGIFDAYQERDYDILFGNRMLSEDDEVKAVLIAAAYGNKWVSAGMIRDAERLHDEGKLKQSTVDTLRKMHEQNDRGDEDMVDDEINNPKSQIMVGLVAIAALFVLKLVSRHA